MIGTGVRAALLADSAVAAIVASRIYPIGNLPQAVPTDTTKWPAISYQRISGHPERIESEGETYEQTQRVQIDCWAATYDAVHTLARLVSLALRKARGGTFGGQEWMLGILTPGGDFYEADTKLHRVSLDWKVTFREET